MAWILGISFDLQMDPRFHNRWAVGMHFSLLVAFTSIITYLGSHMVQYVVLQGSFEKCHCCLLCCADICVLYANAMQNAVCGNVHYNPVHGPQMLVNIHRHHHHHPRRTARPPTPPCVCRAQSHPPVAGTWPYWPPPASVERGSHPTR